MQLLFSLCLAWALLPTAELVRCHECGNDSCTNTTSIECPATMPICRTITTVAISGTNVALTVNKNCSTLLNCITPLTIETEWSVNRGYTRISNTQLCCVTDNCNFQSLAVPNILPNGKVCPACASSADSMAGTCNSTLACMGAEDSCFNGTSVSNNSQVLEQGCLSRNLCSNVIIRQALFGEDSKVVCRAPWSVRLSGVLLAFALTACKVLV